MKATAKKYRKQKAISFQLYSIILVILIVLLIFSILLSITFGNANISIKEVYSVVVYKIFHIDSLSAFAEGAIHDIVWVIRFPRVILAFIIGMGLSVCGVVIQAVVKNQLADPYVLGISSGAYMGATFAILFGFGRVFGSNSIGIMAFLGAVLASFAVLIIANMGSPSNAGKLVLSGMAVGAVCTAFSNFAIYLTHNKEATSEVVFWTMGSLASAKWNNIFIVSVVIFSGTLIFWSQFRNLNLMLLGDEISITLGTNLYKVRSKYMILASLMIGFSVYSAGTIGFIGLIIPHAVRMIFGTEHKRLIPICALIGGIFLIWVDVLCRIILKNSEIPISILVSIIGAPCFIYMMIKHSYGFGGGK